MKLEADQQHDHDLEIIKAVAQAWHSQSSNSRPISEFDAHRLNAFKRKPSRFSLEAIRLKRDYTCRNIGGNHWDFEDSLFDAYEIVSVSKRLESGLVLDHQFSDFGSEQSQAHSSAKTKRRKESKNSLRNLLKL